MKRISLFLAALVFPFAVMAAGAKVPLETANYDLSDKASLQRGAKLFMNYCFACHSLQYERYNRVAKDLGIPEDLMMENLIFTGAKVGDLMVNAMPKTDAAKWFGAAPPDLTLEARLRGPDWIYTYLKSFYADPSRPFGVNNTVFPMVGMPHVLQELQGVAQPITEIHEVNGKPTEVVVGITEADGRGELSTEEYDRAVLDITNFLVYVGEPAKLERHSLGWKVILFLVFFAFVSYFLKREYWRDVH